MILLNPWTNFNEISIEIQTFSFKNWHLKMSSGKWRQFCLGRNVLNTEARWWTDIICRLLFCSNTFKKITNQSGQIHEITVIYATYRKTADGLVGPSIGKEMSYCVDWEIFWNYCDPFLGNYTEQYSCSSAWWSQNVVNTTVQGPSCFHQHQCV